MASQQIQGSANAAIQPIDFQYFPDNPSGNESLANRYEQVLDLDPGNAGAHLGYGLLLFQMERPDKAIPHVEFALRHGYGRPFTHVLLAFCYEQSGNLAHANEILRNCASSFPGSIFVRASYAELLRLEGRLDEAKTQQKVMYRLGEFDARSWELAVRKRPVEAAREAKARGLILPDELFPVLAGALVKARAYHYLKE
jgi:tetratricopeptide (TPR) repeat protein